jgi:hypothetical protein
MSLLPRQALRNARAIHTTTRLLADTPAPSPKSLGFGDYSGRTRSLPTIKIPATGRLNTLKERQPRSTAPSDRPQREGQGPRESKPRTRSPPSDRRQDNPNAPQARTAQAGPWSPRDKSAGPGQQGARKFPEQRNKRQSRSPLAATSKSGSGENDTSTAEGDDFFGSEVDVGTGSRGSTPKSKSNLSSINIAFDSEPAPTGFKARGGRNATSSSSTRKPNSTRERRSSVQAPVQREADDRSAEGIFGRASLLFPVRRGAREAERSIWAEGMKPEDGMSSVYIHGL